MSKNDGGPAYPHTEVHADTSGRRKDGMSLRDYFAGQALAGSCSQSGLDWPSDKYAETAYHMADEMLKERDK